MSYSIQVERLADLVQRHSDSDDAPAIAAVAQALATLQVAEELHLARGGDAPPAPVYLASYETLPMGYYSSREQARAHCASDADRAGLTDLRWVTDVLDDGSEVPDDELWGDVAGQASPLDWRVTLIEVQTAYDPEAED